MRALLVRIGADKTFGGWNAPVDPATGEFVYVPIPESLDAQMQPGLGRRMAEVLPALEAFCGRQGLGLRDELRWPAGLDELYAHLDPDFDALTYGDQGARRGARLRDLGAGDWVVFYAGLRPTTACEHQLIYALVGLYVIDEVVPLPTVPAARWGENAHTRKAVHGATDLIVRARPGVSGRLERCLPIGEFRAGAYRVRRDLLEVWGGLSVKDGYIQRSAVPPLFLAPERFAAWFARQDVTLVARNW